MKKFFDEFKKFISRGNVLDLAVGVIVGSAFTSIVTALTKNIIQPFINWLIYVISGSSGSLEGIYTFLVGNASDIENAIYIDWGAFISSIINFILVAFVLFCVVRAFNRFQQNSNNFMQELLKDIPNKQDRKQMKKLGISIRDDKAVKKFMEEKKARILAEQELAKQAELEKQEQERLANPTTNDLLKDIKRLLENSQNNQEK